MVHRRERSLRGRGERRKGRSHLRRGRRRATAPGWRLAAAAFALVGGFAAGIALVGCGGGSGTPPGTTPDAGAAVRAELLFVVQATGAVIAAPEPSGRAELHLTGVAPSLLAFADRPLRIASTRPTSVLAGSWADYGFAADPPNGALTVGGVTLEEPLALELREPRYDQTAATLDFTVTSLLPDPAAALRARLASGAGGSVALFIDATQPTPTATPPATDDVAALVETLGRITGQTFTPAQQELIASAAAILLQTNVAASANGDTQLIQNNVGLFIDDLQQVLGTSFTSDERQLLVRALVRVIGTGA